LFEAFYLAYEHSRRLLGFGHPFCSELETAIELELEKLVGFAGLTTRLWMKEPTSASPF